ncbi:MAG: amidohydrolase family protein [Roseburia sp.]|nr:amidohydrolase family protein [Roseburia sp.]
MHYIKNAKLVLETGILWDGVLAMDGGRIAAYGAASEIEIPTDAEVMDAKGLYVGPGFVDIHVHGGGDSLFIEDAQKTAGHFLNHGTTTMLPTFYTDLSKERFLEGIEHVKHVKETTEIGKAIGGIYTEGPYMNPKYGANADQNKWRGDILPEMYEEVVDAAGTLAKVWAVAPEREGLQPFLSYAKKANPDVVFAVGHSEANPDQIQKLKRYGFCLQTHCMNATGRIETWAGTRACGPDEYCMTDSDMYAELICDSLGIHVNPAMIRMILKIKSVDKIVLITDSFVSHGQAPEGLRHVTDIHFDNGGGLCGSKLTMDVACRNMMTHTNCGIAQVFLMAARNPARVIGMEDEIGTIEVGKKANLIFVDDMFHVDTVILEGQIWNKQSVL